MSMMYTFLSLLYPSPSKRDILPTQYTNNMPTSGSTEHTFVIEERLGEVTQLWLAAKCSLEFSIYTQKKPFKQNAIRFDQHTDSTGSVFFHLCHYMLLKTMTKRLKAELKSPVQQTNLFQLDNQHQKEQTKAWESTQIDPSTSVKPSASRN